MKNASRRATETPKVSIILPTFNRASTLPRAVESVLRQDYGDFELIIVDDASSDQTGQVIETFKDGRIVYVRNSKNLGAAAARNVGISLARGTFVAFQDSDDVWLAGKLRRQVESLSDPAQPYDACFSSYWSIGPAGMRLVPATGAVDTDGDLFGQLLRGNLVSMPTLVVKKSSLLEVGALDERLPRLMDWDLALKLARSCRVLFCEEPLLLACDSGQGISGDVKAYLEAVDIIMSKYAPYYRDRWWLIVNHHLFNAKYLARNRSFLPALSSAAKALGALLDRALGREMRV